MVYYNLRSLVVFWPRNVAAVLIIAVATAVFALLSGVLDSFSGLIQTSSERDNVGVVSRGGLSERWPDMSHVKPEAVSMLSALPEVKTGPGGVKLVSPEYLYTGEISAASRRARITVRGVEERAFLVHTKVHGTLRGGEVLLGGNVAALLGDVDVGDTLVFAGRNWRVGGLLESRVGQSQFDSEIWAPVTEVMQARRASDYGLVIVKVNSPRDVTRMASTVNADEGRMKELRAVPETMMDSTVQTAYEAFRAVQIVLSVLLMGVAGTAVVSLLLNNVLRRRRDMALLRANGSSGFDVALGFAVEGGVLALSGAVLGALAATLASGIPIMTGSMQRFGTVVVRLHFSVETVLLAIVVGVMVGVVCALIPAWSSGRSSILRELRDG
jgi:ABC-type lipoprotein release transport system permease subunit